MGIAIAIFAAGTVGFGIGFMFAAVCFAAHQRQQENQGSAEFRAGLARLRHDAGNN